MTQRKHAVPLALTLLCLLIASGVAQSAPTVADIVAKMPADNAAAGQPLLEEIVKLGPAGLKELCGMVTPPAQAGDAKARYALHGLALHSKRPGAEAERKMMEDALLDALAAAKGPDVKAFFTEQIQLVGSRAAAAPLGKLLADDRLCEPATQALLRIAAPECVAQIRAALPTAKGKNLVTIVHALGAAADRESAKAILPHAAAEDATLRRTAWFALAEIGDGSATAALAKAAAAAGAYERSVGTKCYLRLAARLVERGDKDACARICRDLLATRTTPADAHVCCAALRVLVGAVGPVAADDLLAAVDSENAYVREAALAILEGMPGAAVTEKCAAKGKGGSPRVREAVVAMLGRRGDAAAAPAVLAALEDGDSAVRRAAMPALAKLSPREAIKLLPGMMSSTDADVIRSAKETLAWMKAEGFSSAVAAAVPKASAPGRAALIEVLAARGATDQAKVVFDALGDADEGVRQAATRALAAVARAEDLPRIVRRMLEAGSDRERMDARTILVQLCRATGAGARPVLAFLTRADGQQRAVLLGTLARIGGPEALAAVAADVEKGGESVKDAAIRALADWQGPEAAPLLLKLAREASSDVHRVLAVRGLVRVLGLPSDRPPAETAALFEQALAAARPAEKKAVLGGLGKVRTTEALAVAGKCLDDPALVEEAAAAAVNIACPAGGRDKGLRGPVVKEVLEKVVRLSKNKSVVQKAAGHLGA